jgi:hypothetical protein
MPSLGTHQVQVKMTVEGPGFVQKRHIGFTWCSVLFSVVAFSATCDQVFPDAFTAARLRQDMIQGQLIWKSGLAAILASVFIP